MRALSSVVLHLQRTANNSPDRIAVVDDDRSITYAMLWARACYFSSCLKVEGLQRGDRFAVLLENSIEYVIALYGALMAGAIVVPMNAAAKSRDFIQWLGHSGAKWAIYASDQVEARVAVVQSPGVISIDLALLLDNSSQVNHRFELVAPAASEPACLLYTSGTTGNPKAVTLSHGNLASNSTAIVEYLQLSAEDSIVCILPFYYSYGSSVLHTHVQVGACIVLEHNLLYPHAIVDSIARHKVTGFAGVPSTFSLLLARVSTLQNYDLSHLRYITQAGGAMSPALTERLRAALPRASLFVMYGQTEATARITYLSPEHLDRKIGSVGRPLSNVEIEVRTESGEPCGAMQPGEVWVKGPSVMLGYWNNPQATDAALHQGWLRTGDMGHLDEDGYLFLAGRRSDMIKTGAHRVHPQEVEEVILELPDVEEVAVVGIDDGILGQAIKAFVVATESRELDLLKLKAHCRDRLANYKVPKQVEVVSGLPKTQSGKIRRQALIQRSVV